MALTRITKGVIKPNENYDTHNIVSTGIVTAIGLDINGNGDVSGDLNVGGVLTYEDVTSIDSVGLITARNGIDCNGDLDVDGHTNLDNVSVAGVSTFALSSTFGDKVKISSNVNALSAPSVAGNYHLHIANPQNDAGETAGIAFGLSTGGDIGAAITHERESSNSVGNLRFYTKENSNPASMLERMRISKEGNVGIGTDSPSAKLEIFGVTTTTGNLNVTDGRILIAQSTAPQVRINSSTADGSSTRFVFGLATGANQFINGTVSNDACITAPQEIKFGIGNNLRFRITDSLVISPQDIVPSGNNIKSLGNSNYRWSDLFAVDADISGNLNVSGDVIIGTSTWQYKKALNVQGSSGSILSLYNADTTSYAADTTTGIELRLNTGNTGNTSASCEIRAFKENGTNGNSARALSFYTGVNGGSPTERLRITSTGTVGVNCTPLGLPLEVKQLSANGGALRLRDASATYRYLDFDVTGALTQITARSNNSHGNIDIGTLDQFGRTTQLYIKGGSNAKVGIGTDNPSHELDIESSSPVIEMKDNDAGDSRFQIAQSGAQTYLDMDVGGLGSSSLRFRFAGEEKVRFTTAGLVGIGTNNPGYNIESYGTDPSIIVHHPFESRGGIAAFENQKIALVTTYVNDDLVFGYSNSTLSAGNFVERMRIDNGTGNVSINKSTGISAKLHIGDSNNNAALSQLIKLGNDSSGAGTGAQINMGAAHGNESTAACIAGFLDSDGGTSFTVKTAGTYANQSTVGERLRITSEGHLHVGSGQTTSTNYEWAPKARFRVESNSVTDSSMIHFGTRAGNAGGADPAVVFLRRGGSTLWVHHAARIYYDTEKFNFETAAPVAPGSHSFGKRMVIKHNGNIGIGIDNPGYRLEIGDVLTNNNIKIGSRITGQNYGIAFGYYDNLSGAHGFGIDRKHGGTLTTNAFVMRADTGNVGIGTDNPTQLIDVYKTSNDAVIKTRTTGAGAYFDADSASSGFYGLRLKSSGTDKWFLGSYGSAKFTIKDGSGFSGTERFTILDTSGKVGISTASPAAKLEVLAQGNTEGGIFITDSDNSQPAPYLRVLGKRSDGNTHQSFSGRILLASLRTDAKVNSGRKVGVIMFGGNHTNTSESNILYPASIAAVAGSSYDSATDMPTDLVFYTGSTGRAPNTNNVSSGDERLRIKSGGNIEMAQDVRLVSLPNSGNGAGIIFGGNGYGGNSTNASCVVTNGNYHLDARGGSYGIYLNWYGGDKGTYFGNGSSGQRGRIDGSGNLTLSGTYPGSDLRLKENIQNISGATDTIKSLVGKTFTWKAEAGLDDWKHYGFIAQEVQKVTPDLVKDIGCHYFDKDDKLVTDIDPTESDEDRKNKGITQSLTVNNEGVTPILVEAMKELIAKVETLEAKVSALEGS